jgi:hypothetical protein
LVAGETREGYVYERLLRKIEAESEALQGKVFDVLGALFEREPLRKLLLQAIRYGDHPDVKAKLEQQVDNAVDQERVRELLEARSLAAQTMDTSQLMRIREDMERYNAKRLQPHYIKSFFMQAFEMLGGSIQEREPGRYRISYVPARIRNRAKTIGTHVPVLKKYDRVCFDKALMTTTGLRDADFICPGHPLLDTIIDLISEKYNHALRSGSVLVDKSDPGESPRVLFFLEHAIEDASGDQNGDKRVISREVHFVEIDADGEISMGGSAPYLDYEPATPEQLSQIEERLSHDWIVAEKFESQAISYAIENQVPRHLARWREQREKRIDKTLAAVHERLTKEINYWDRRAAELRQGEKAGKSQARLNAQLAQQRADDLANRLEQRREKLERERQLSARPPVIVGGAVVIPMGLLLGESTAPDGIDRRITEAIAMKTVMEKESRLGHHPRDVSAENRGYDIESFDPRTERLRFLEVKGRRAGADTVTVTKNEILTGINAGEQYYLAVVEVEDGEPHPPRYVQKPFVKEPDFGVTSVNYGLTNLIKQTN